ncbi:MAG: transcriptional repressor [Candidatus Kariarchaeaceae archaeon]
MSPPDEELVIFLHSKGFKVTPQRLAIFNFLINNDSHPSAEIICEEMKKTYFIAHGSSVRFPNLIP